MKRVLRYVQYKMKARSKYDLHSPFAYELWSKVLLDRQHHNEFTVIEHLRKKLRNDSGYIRMCDRGARSTEIAWCRKVLQIRKIVKKSAVSPRYGKLLFRLVRHFSPQSILELGTSMGISTGYLSLGNPEAIVTTIEGCPETAEVAQKNFKTLGLKNIHQITGSFEDELPACLMNIGKIDMVFIDGNHRKEPTLNYFSNLLKHIHENSVIVFDDIHWSDEMEEAWKVIKNHPSVKMSVDLFQIGILFFREGLSKEDFVISYR
ncbi:MAG: O-methyltransferase [Syntrophothermus sp.]